MQARLDFTKASPEAIQAVLGLENYVAKQSGLDPHLIHLLKLRASQINGCAYCVDMHSKEARRSGLSEQWINLISVWLPTRRSNPSGTIFPKKKLWI